MVNKELAILSNEIKYPIELCRYLLGCSCLMSIVKYTTIDMLFSLIKIQHNWGILNNVQHSEHDKNFEILTISQLEGSMMFLTLNNIYICCYQLLRFMWFLFIML